MMNLPRLLLSAAAMSAVLPQLHATSPAFGNINVVQNDAGNAATSVTATLTYTQAARSADGTTELGSFNLRAGSNRGDFNLRFTSNAANDRAQGIMISNVAQLARDNSAAGDPAGAYFATSATANDANGYFIAVQAVTSDGPEFNANLAAAWFPYADGWIGGHAVNSANGGVLTSLTGSAGLSLSTTATGPNTLYDPGATGVYELSLADINSQTDGILIVSGGKNEDNYALSKSNADGSWTITVRDNFSGSTNEGDGFAFVYVPTTAAVTGNAPGVHAMGRLNGNLSRDVSAGNYAMVRAATGQYRLYAPGIDPAQSTLLISPESGGIAGDNILFHESTSKGWNIESRDLTPLGLQDNTATEDTVSFVLMASTNTAAVWDGGGANTNWGTVGNWQGDTAPVAGRDVIIGSGTGNIAVNTPQSAGMLYISRDTGFTLSGSTLSLGTGLIVNAQPSSTQTYIVSAPLVLTEDAFIMAQTLGSSIALRLDVASGNAITAVDKNLTLGGGSGIEIRDPISLGNGNLIKEGANQITVLAASSFSQSFIVSGPNSQTNGAFRLNAAAAYGAFGAGDINMQNVGDVTAIYFDSGAGSGTLQNTIRLQTTNADSGTRFVVDSAAGFNATLSGMITGGEATSEFFVGSDAANGLGRLHLTNLNNNFIAERINIARGGLVIYGDGSLGTPSNGIYLNTANTNANTDSGLHFGADNITVAATRSVEIASDSVINTGAFHGTIAGIVSGTGGLMKAGTGTLSFTAATGNTYQGATTVMEGTLSLEVGSGSATGTGTVTVLSGATLSGSGSVAGAAIFMMGSTLNPGNSSSAGTLVFGPGLDLQAGSTVKLDLVNASSYDQLQVTAGPLGVAATSVLQISLHYTPQAGDTFDLLDWVSLSGDSVLVDNLDVPDLSGLGLEWNFTQFDSLGVLSIQNVPEPSRALLLMLGFAGGLLRRRR
ncbi:MAG: PEP-CTERM sorting domain-containing protein [Prosthecobacter sp.]